MSVESLATDRISLISRRLGWSTSTRRVLMVDRRLPPLLSCESLIKENENLWYVELDVLEVQFFLAVFLHFQQIIELEVKL